MTHHRVDSRRCRAKLPGATEGIHPIYARFFEQRIRFSRVDQDQLASLAGYAADGFSTEVDQYDASGNTEVVVFPTKNLLVEQVEERGFSADIVESADEISLNDMLAFQAMYQKCYADNAVSFTVNVPEGMDQDKVARTVATYLPDLKGTTIMPDGSRPQAPFTRITEAEYEAARIALAGDGIDEDCASGACPIR